MSGDEGLREEILYFWSKYSLHFLVGDIGVKEMEEMGRRIL